MGAVTALIYSVLILAVTLLVCCRRKKPEVNQQPAAQKPRDARPVLTINGTALLDSPISQSKLVVLQDLSQRFRVYIPCLATNDEAEKNLLSQISGVLPGYRVLFYKVETGYLSIIRQLNPAIHLESSVALALEMRRYLESIIMVSEGQCEGFLQVMRFEDTPAFLRSII